MATGRAFVVNSDGKLDTQYNVYTQSDINIAKNRGYDTSHVTPVSEEAKAVYQNSDSRALFGNSASGGAGITSGLNDVLQAAVDQGVKGFTSDGTKVTANMLDGKVADVVLSYDTRVSTGNAGSPGRAPEGYSPSVNSAGSNLQGLLNGVAGLPEVAVATATSIPSWVWVLGAGAVVLYLGRHKLGAAYDTYKGKQSDIDLLVDKQWASAVKKRATTRDKSDRIPVM